MDGIGNFGNIFNDRDYYSSHPVRPLSPSSPGGSHVEAAVATRDGNQEVPLNRVPNSRDANLARTLRSRVPHRPRTPSFTWEDVTRVTKITGEQTVDELFPNLEADDLDTVFGSEREPLRNVSTKLNFELAFCNSYGKTTWAMCDNVRHPDMAPGFHMNDVVAHQAALAGVKGCDVKRLVRHNVNSKTGMEFFRRHQFRNKENMDPDQLEEFMRTTVNGKSSGRILDDNHLRVESARVLKYPGEFNWDEYSVVFTAKPKSSS